MTFITENTTIIILMMIGILFLAGCVMEATPNIVILAPNMLPLAIPYVFAMGFVVLLLAFIPQLSLWAL